MKKGSKSSNKKSILVVVLLLLVGVTAYFAANTYAKYITAIDGNTGQVTVAKWNFKTDNQTQTVEIKLADTVDVSTLVANRIAPGTKGSFNVVLKNTSETGADFTIKLDGIADKPANLKFYRDDTYTNELVPDTTEITGQLKAEDSTGLTVPIYWRWVYETANGDAADTADGEAGRTLTVGLDIVGVQTAPSSTAITSHVNPAQ